MYTLVTNIKSIGLQKYVTLFQKVAFFSKYFTEPLYTWKLCQNTIAETTRKANSTNQVLK